jgi:ankyrin repeat protein
MGSGGATWNRPLDERRLQALAVVETGHRRFEGDDLEDAIQQGEADLITAFLDAGWGPNQPLDLTGKRPLHQAAAYGQAAIVRLLLARGADSNAPDKQGATPLNLAADAGKPEVVTLLLEGGADIHGAGRGALFSALREADCAATIRLLLARGADPGQCDAVGLTPLMEAARWNRAEALATLLERPYPAVLARRDKHGQTALGHTLSSDVKGLPATRLLLAAGADPIAPGGKETDLERAWNFRSPAGPDLEATVLRRDPLAAGALLGPAILHDRMEFAAALLAAGVPADGLDAKARLFLAAATGDAATLTAVSDQELLATKGLHDETLLARAARHGQPATVRVALAALKRRQATWPTPPKPPWGCREMLDAAEGGDAVVVQNLLAAGAEPNTRDYQGYRPLHRAAQGGHHAAATILLAHGADPNAANNWGETPLVTAAQTGSAGVVQVLLAAGAGVNGRAFRGVTPLLAAVQVGRSDVARILVAAGANPYLVSDHDNSCAALVAAAGGDPELMDAVAPACTETMFQTVTDDDRGAGAHFARRLLHQAIGDGRTDVVRSLLRVGVQPDIGGRNYSRLPLAEAAALRKVEILEMLVKAGFDANEEHRGWTVLMTAAVHPACWQSTGWGEVPDDCPTFEKLAPDPGVRRVIEILVAHGADPNARNSDGQTPLMVAAARGGPEAASALIAAGARLEDAGEDGNRALNFAAASGNVPVAAVLLDADAAPDGGEVPPLWTACDNQQWKVARLLLDRGARPNASIAEYGRTPLMEAAVRGDDETVKALLDAGADPRMTRDGGTALAVAARSGHRELARRIYRILYARQPDILPMPEPSGDEPDQWVELGPDPIWEFTAEDTGGADEGPGERVDGTPPFNLEDYLLDSIRVGEPAPVEVAVRSGHLSRMGRLAENLLLEAARYGEHDILGAILAAQTTARRRVAGLLAARAAEWTRESMDAPLPVENDMPDSARPAEKAVEAGSDESSLQRDEPSDADAWIRPVLENFGRAALAAAIWRDDAPAVERLLQAGVDARATYPDGLTPLHLAADKGPELVRLLVSAGADVDARAILISESERWNIESGGLRDDDYLVSEAEGFRPPEFPQDATPLFLALKRGRADTVELLIRAGRREPPLEELAAPDHSAESRPLLHSAAQRGEIVRLRLLLGVGADPDLPDQEGRTALMIAAENGYVGATLALLAAGADPSRSDPAGHTAWHFAARRDHATVIRELAAAGASPPKAETAPVILDYLLSQKEESEPYRGKQEVMAALLLAGADVNASDAGGRTPLAWACIRDWGEVAAMLLDFDADPNRADASGRTPLHHVIADDEGEPVFERRWDLIDLLVKRGADIRRKDRSGCSPLDWANTLRSRRLINVLFQEEIFPNHLLEGRSFGLSSSTPAYRR